MQTDKLPTPEKLRELFSYDADTGLLVSKRFAGRVAPSYGPKKYSTVCVNYRDLYVHRVVWALTHGAWPEGEIDHINGDRSDNRLVNLRLVSHSQNMKNSPIKGNNTSGTLGISWHKASRKWHARIYDGGHCHSLGYFADKEAACVARKSAEEIYGFHPNHGRAA